MGFEKIDPELLLTYQDYRGLGISDLTRRVRTLDIQDDESRTTSVFLDCDEAAQLDYLERYGIQVHQQKGKIRTALLPLDSLEDLSKEPAVTRVVPSRYLYPLMDAAPSSVQLPQFYQKTGLTGEGVIIGIVDTGIDASHPAFQGRIWSIWDQTLQGPGMPEFPYGVELTRNDLMRSIDTNGHGTHVAGIAAGDDADFGGVAPGAECIIVKSDLSNTSVSDGIRYIFQVASELGRPAVVNLSLGGHGDPHDGTDLFSQLIDAESGEGRIVCCAAGNEGNDDIHAQARVPQDETCAMHFRVPRSSSNGRVVLNGWYSGQDRMEVAVESPNGYRTPYQTIRSTGEYWESHPLPDARVLIATPGPDPENEDHRFLIQITPLTTGIGTWKLWLRGIAIQIGQVDVWSLDDNPNADVIFIGQSVSNSLKIGSPGAARRAITVASYTTKVEWENINGDLIRTQYPLNDISEFSSEGPLRNGTQKPDVTAPGAFIASCRSAAANVPVELQINTRYTVKKGTSMATPFVSGIVALLLERNPMLSPEAIKELLYANSTIPGRSNRTFDPKWGFGLINADSLADVVV